MAGIFISYRRSDTEGWAGRLSDSLKLELGADTTFRDIESIPPGVEYASYLAEAVGSCEVFIALIGPRWLSATLPSGQRRLDDPTDLLRKEIVLALRSTIRVIPVLVGGATMPAVDDLPEDIKPLVGRQDHELTDRRWADDCRKRAAALEPLVKKQLSTEPPVKESRVGLLSRHGATLTAAGLTVILAVGAYGIKARYDTKNSSLHPATGDGANQSANRSGSQFGIAKELPPGESARPPQGAERKSRVLLRLDRKWYTPTSAMGELYVDGRLQGFTLERTPAIPSGKYSVALKNSERFRAELPFIQVPGRGDVMIHPGNTTRDLGDGAIAVGRERRDESLTDSRGTLAALLEEIRKGGTHGAFLEIVDAR